MMETGDMLRKHCRVFYGLDGRSDYSNSLEKKKQIAICLFPNRGLPSFNDIYREAFAIKFLSKRKRLSVTQSYMYFISTSKLKKSLSCP